MAKQHGTYLVFDIYNDDFILQEGAKVGMLPESIEKEKKVGRTQRENFSKALQAARRSPSAPTPASIRMATTPRQFAKMVEWGMKPTDAIQAATIKAADLIGWADKVGAIETGHFADIIAVVGDPTSDVRLLENRAVCDEGRSRREKRVRRASNLGAPSARILICSMDHRLAFATLSGAVSLHSRARHAARVRLGALAARGCPAIPDRARIVPGGRHGARRIRQPPNERLLDRLALALALPDDRVYLSRFRASRCGTVLRWIGIRYSGSQPQHWR